MNIITLKEKLQAGIILSYKAKRGILSISGPDAQNFLQRMSTNDLSKLTKMTPIPSCFVNQKGRMIDLGYVYEQSPEHFLLVSSYEHASVLSDWLNQFHFVEDFVITDKSYDFSAIYNFAKSNAVLERANIVHVGDFTIDELSCSAFLSLDEKENLDLIDDQCFDMIRINMCKPGLGEISASYMPQNIGLKDCISENKGCYIGQEVIAKALTYQKNVKVMTGFKMTEAVFNNAKLGSVIRDNFGHHGLISSLSPVYWPTWAQGLVILDPKEGPAEGLDADFIVPKS